MKPIPESEDQIRGRKLLVVPTRLIVGILNWKRHQFMALPDLSAMPNDVLAESVNFSLERQAWVICLSSVEWEDTPGGQELPVINGFDMTVRQIQLRQGNDGLFGAAERKVPSENPS